MIPKIERNCVVGHLKSEGQEIKSEPIIEAEESLKQETCEFKGQIKREPQISETSKSSLQKEICDELFTQNEDLKSEGQEIKSEPIIEAEESLNREWPFLRDNREWILIDKN